MEQEQLSQASEEHKHFVNRVTPVSKYLAMAMFVLLPFIGGYIGYTFAPEKVVEVEKVIVRDVVSDEVKSTEQTPEKMISEQKDTKKIIKNIESMNFVIDGGEQNTELSWPIYSTSTVSLYDGEEYFKLYSANEHCVLRPRDELANILDDVNGRSKFMSKYIDSVDDIHSAVSCWVAGGGYEMYLLENKDGQIQVIGFTVDELSPEQSEIHSPFGEVEILYP